MKTNKQSPPSNLNLIQIYIFSMYFNMNYMYTLHFQENKKNLKFLSINYENLTEIQGGKFCTLMGEQSTTSTTYPFIIHLINYLLIV